MADYRRKYRQTTKSREARKAYRDGAQTMRKAIVEHLEGIGGADLNGFAAANAVENLEIP